MSNLKQDDVSDAAVEPISVSALEVEHDSGRSRENAWSLVVLLAASVLCAVVHLPLGASSILLVEWLDVYHDQREILAFAGSVNTGCLFFISPVSSFLSVKYGYRIATVIGSIVCALGLVASAYATNSFMLVATFGVITGCGGGIVRITSIAVVPMHFDKHRNVAASAASITTGAMYVITPLLVRWLSYHYGWRSTHIALACVVLQSTVLGMLLHQPPLFRDRSVKHASFSTESHFTLRQLLTHSTSCLYLGHVAVGTGCSVTLLVADYAAHRGLNKEQGAVLVSCTGASNILVRVCVTLAGSLTTGRAMHLTVLAAAFRALAVFLIPAFHTVWTLGTANFLFGIGWGIYSTMAAVSLSELYGISLMNPLLGFCSMTFGIGFSCGAPIAGLIFTSSGSYIWPWCFSGLAISVGMILTAMAIVLQNNSVRKPTRPLSKILLEDKAIS